MDLPLVLQQLILTLEEYLWLAASTRERFRSVKSICMPLQVGSTREGFVASITCYFKIVVCLSWYTVTHILAGTDFWYRSDPCALSCISNAVGRMGI